MTRLVSSAIFLIIQFQFYSCHIPHDREIICYGNFKIARDLAYKNPANTFALDSALIIVNNCMQCDSIKREVVDLKIRLLITLGKLNEGSEFVNSMQASEFMYPYKKKLNQNNFIALNFAFIKDTISRDKIFREMTTDLEQYINNNSPNSKEFQEAYLDLFTLKGNFTDSMEINREIDSLKIKYPSDATFFDFLKL